MKPILLATVLVLSGATTQLLAQTSPAAPRSAQSASARVREKFDPKRDPAKDLAKAIKLAGKEHKYIILDVGGEWCPWCVILEKFFLENADAEKFLKANFVTVKVNYSDENRNEEFFSHYPKVPSYPHLFVLDSKGKLLYAQDTGLLESGDHHDHDKVMAFLKKWAPPARKVN